MSNRLGHVSRGQAPRSRATKLRPDDLDEAFEQCLEEIRRYRKYIEELEARAVDDECLGSGCECPCHLHHSDGPGGAGTLES